MTSVSVLIFTPSFQVNFSSEKNNIVTRTEKPKNIKLQSKDCLVCFVLFQAKVNVACVSKTAQCRQDSDSPFTMDSLLQVE